MPAPTRVPTASASTRSRGFCPPSSHAGTHGWAPKQLFNAYTNSLLTLEEFEGPRYQRIGHIKHLVASGLLDNAMRFREAEVAAREAVAVCKGLPHGARETRRP